MNQNQYKNQVYEQKYLKYKAKYLLLKNQLGGNEEFIDAVKENNIEKVKAKLDGKYTIAQKLGTSKPSDVNQIDPVTHVDALTLSIKYKYENMVKLLLEYKANPNRLLENKTALITAIEFRNMNIVKLLLDHGADPNIYPDNNFELTPLYLISKHLTSFVDKRNRHSIPPNEINIFADIISKTNLESTIISNISFKIDLLPKDGKENGMFYISEKLNKKVNIIQKKELREAKKNLIDSEKELKKKKIKN